MRVRVHYRLVGHVVHGDREMKMMLQTANHPEGTVVAYLKATKEM